MMNRIKGVAAALAAVAALGVGGAAIASATGNGPLGDKAEDAAEGPDQAIGGSALDKASAAALEFTGGGQVSGTEVGDEESYYEVEVTRDDVACRRTARSRLQRRRRLRRRGGPVAAPPAGNVTGTDPRELGSRGSTPFSPT
jgi:hypothetical protein